MPLLEYSAGAPQLCLGGGCALSPPTDVFPTIPTSSVARNPPTPLPRVRGPGRKGLALLHLRRYAEAAEAYRKGLALAHPPAPPMPSQRALFFYTNGLQTNFPKMRSSCFASMHRLGVFVESGQ